MSITKIKQLQSNQAIYTTAEGLKLGILVGEQVGAAVGDSVGAPAAYVDTIKKDNTHFKERDWGAKIIRTRRVQPINQTKSSLQDGTAVGMFVGTREGCVGKAVGT